MSSHLSYAVGSLFSSSSMIQPRTIDNSKLAGISSVMSNSLISLSVDNLLSMSLAFFSAFLVTVFSLSTLVTSGVGLTFIISCIHFRILQDDLRMSLQLFFLIFPTLGSYEFLRLQLLFLHRS